MLVLHYSFSGFVGDLYTEYVGSNCKPARQRLLHVGRYTLTGERSRQVRKSAVRMLRGAAGFSVQADSGVSFMLQMQQMAMVMQKQMRMQQQQAGMTSDAPAHEQLQAMQAAQVRMASAQAQSLCT